MYWNVKLARKYYFCEQSEHDFYNAKNLCDSKWICTRKKDGQFGGDEREQSVWSNL